MIDKDIKTITYYEYKIEIPNWCIEYYEQQGVSINKDYFDYLLQYCNPYERNKERVDREIYHLLELDIENRRIFDTNCLGNIVKYNTSGEVLCTYKEPYNIFNDLDNSQYTYGFENYYKRGIITTRNRIEFFGLKYKPLYDQMCCRNGCLTELNLLISRQFRWLKGIQSQKFYEDPYFTESLKDLSLEQFREQKTKYMSFSIGAYAHSGLRRTCKLIKRMELDEQEYYNALDKLITRYTYQGHALIKKVENLGDYRHSRGIYILVLPEFRGFYIGQTCRNITSRIKRHWLDISSTFDRSYGPLDIKEIYAIKVPPNYINVIEQDCIATIPPIYCLNSLAGGFTLESVHSEHYNSCNYQCCDEELNYYQSLLMEEN